jgi:ParB-like nuclease domain
MRAAAREEEMEFIMADPSSGLPKSVKIGNLTFNLPWIELVPRPSQEEYEALKASITESGMVEPVLVADTGDPCTLNVLDGNTRILIASELGLPLNQVQWSVKDYPDEESQMTVAVLTNTCRRSWTRERRLATVMKLFTEKNWSIKQIARALGVSRGQVQYDLDHLGLTRPAAQPREAENQAGQVDSTGVPNLAPVDDTHQPGSAGGAGADPALPAVEDSSPVWPTPEDIEAATLAVFPPPAGGVQRDETAREEQPDEPAAPNASPRVETAAEQRAKALQRATDHVRGLNKACSELNVWDRVRDNIQAILRVLEDVGNGAAQRGAA